MSPLIVLGSLFLLHSASAASVSITIPSQYAEMIKGLSTEKLDQLKTGLTQLTSAVDATVDSTVNVTQNLLQLEKKYADMLKNFSKEKLNEVKSTLTQITAAVNTTVDASVKQAQNMLNSHKQLVDILTKLPSEKFNDLKGLFANFTSGINKAVNASVKQTKNVFDLQKKYVEMLTKLPTEKLEELKSAFSKIPQFSQLMNSINAAVNATVKETQKVLNLQNQFVEMLKNVTTGKLDELKTAFSKFPQFNQLSNAINSAVNASVKETQNLLKLQNKYVVMLKNITTEKLDEFKAVLSKIPQFNQLMTSINEALKSAMKEIKKGLAMMLTQKQFADLIEKLPIDKLEEALTSWSNTFSVNQVTNTLNSTASKLATSVKETQVAAQKGSLVSNLVNSVVSQPQQITKAATNFFSSFM